MTDAQRRAAENAPRLSERDDIEGGAPRRGDVLQAFLQSPLVGAELDLDRETTAGRDLPL